MTQRSSERVLILKRVADESESCHRILARHGVESFICNSLVQAGVEYRNGAAALFCTLDLLTGFEFDKFLSILKTQAMWSHFPVVILKPEGQFDSEALRPLMSVADVTFVDDTSKVEDLIESLRAAISDRKRQYQMRDLLHELEISRGAAIEASRAKSDFLANMSHEIRTPLGAILGFAELMMEEGVSDRERQVYMTAVKRNGQILSALIDDILDLSKVEAGRIEIEKLEFSINELISEIVSTLEPQASKKSLPLLVEKLPRGSEIAIGDPIRLKQVLVNIVGNAIKFTSHGSVAVRVRIDEEVDGQRDLHVEVEDTGIGISSRQAAHLFKPFTQGDSSTTRRFGGTGLGLVLAQKLAMAMGGGLNLKWSIPGGGSCFEIMVRLDAVKRVEEEPPVKLITPPRLPLENACILLVDDSLDNQLLISQILKLLGADVEIANDGLEGVEKALARTYDIVLMDLQMPRLGGVEATRILREKGYKHPIVALTAHALKEDRQKCLSVGCTDYLTKPIQRAHLVQVLERVAREGATSQTRH